jgi:hypothetical protein
MEEAAMKVKFKVPKAWGDDDMRRRMEQVVGRYTVSLLTAAMKLAHTGEERGTATSAVIRHTGIFAFELGLQTALRMNEEQRAKTLHVLDNDPVTKEFFEAIVGELLAGDVAERIAIARMDRNGEVEHEEEKAEAEAKTKAV